jgi:hypothetical protein
MTDEFRDRVDRALLTLPQDLKAALRLVEDGDLEDAERKSLAGAVLHVLSGANVIPGTRGVLALVGSVLVLRVAIQRVRTSNAEVVGEHVALGGELYEDLDAVLEAARKFLGDGFSVLEKAAESTAKVSFQGHTPAQCVDDAEASRWLYDTVEEAIVERFTDMDEDEIGRELKRLPEIVEPLRLKARTSA